MARRNYNNLADERHDEIFDDEQFTKDVKRGVTVKRLMEKYNVSQYRVVEKKRELNLLDMRYVNKMKKIKKSI